MGRRERPCNMHHTHRQSNIKRRVDDGLLIWASPPEVLVRSPNARRHLGRVRQLFSCERPVSSRAISQPQALRADSLWDDNPVRCITAEKRRNEMPECCETNLDSNSPLHLAQRDSSPRLVVSMENADRTCSKTEARLSD